MASLQQWDYSVHSVYYKVTKTKVIGQSEGSWFIWIDNEQPLTRGLEYLGLNGFELVGIQTTQMLSAGSSNGQWFKPDYYYVFKRPHQI